MNYIVQYLLTVIHMMKKFPATIKSKSMITTFVTPMATILNHFKLVHTISCFFQICSYSLTYSYVSDASFPLSFPTKILYTLLTSTTCATQSNTTFQS